MSVSQRASQIWAVLAWVAKHRRSITYQELAYSIVVPTVALGQFLGPIHSVTRVYVVTAGRAKIV